jgi:hypothetical protein
VRSCWRARTRLMLKLAADENFNNDIVAAVRQRRPGLDPVTVQEAGLRRTPVRAILEAGRAMLAMPGQFDVENGTGWEDGRLIGKDCASVGRCELTFDNGIQWRVPTVAGDGLTPDRWYPRPYQGDSWAMRTATLVGDLAVRNPMIPRNKGKKVWVRPSRFDFEFLDSTGRRYEIYYDSQGRRPRRTRPFYLEDLDRFAILWDFMLRLSVSQRHQVVQTIEATRDEWYAEPPQEPTAEDAAFRQLVSDTLAGANWPRGKAWNTIPAEWRTKLIDAGVSGELADLAELHMEILRWQEALRRLQIGGERGYGWGDTELVEIEPGTDQRLFDRASVLTDGSRPVVCLDRADASPARLLAHAKAGGIRAEGEIEPLVGREWRSENKRHRHAGQHVEFMGMAFQPGGVVRESVKLEIGEFGVWKPCVP